MIQIYFTGTVIAMIITMVSAIIYLSQSITVRLKRISEEIATASNKNIDRLIAEQMKQNYILVDISNNLPRYLKNPIEDD